MIYNTVVKTKDVVERSDKSSGRFNPVNAGGWVYKRNSPTEVELVWSVAGMTGMTCYAPEVKNYSTRAHKNSHLKVSLIKGAWKVTSLFHGSSNLDSFCEALNSCPVQSAEIKEVIEGWEEYLTLGYTSSKVLADRMGAQTKPPETKTLETEKVTTMNKIGLTQGKLIKFDDKQNSTWINGSATIASLNTLLSSAAFPEKETKDVSLLFQLVDATEVKVVMNIPSMTVDGVENAASLSSQGARQHQNAVVTATYNTSRGEWIASNITWKGGPMKIFKDAFNKNDVLVAELNELTKGWQEVLTNGTTSSTVLQERYNAPKVGAKVQKVAAETKTNNVTAEKEGNKKMSNGISVKDFIGSPKAEATNAMWRVAAGSAVDLVRDPLIEAICSQMGAGKNKLLRNKIALFLTTGMGRGLVAMALAMLMPGINMMVPDDMKPHMDRLAKELREHGYEHVMLPLAGLITGPIKDQLVKAVQGVSVMQKLQTAVATGEDGAAENAELIEQVTAAAGHAKA